MACRHGWMSCVRAIVGLTLLVMLTPAYAATVISKLVVTGSTCAASFGNYTVQTGFLAGAKQFIDRDFTINGTVPTALNNQTFIQTCNGDKNLSPGATNLISFSVGQDSKVYVLHDVQVTPQPTWLTNGFTDLGMQVTNDNSHTFEVFVSNTTYPNGATVTLGSNTQSGTNTAYAMYTVVVVPAAPLISALKVPNTTSSGYVVQSNGFTVGAVQYVDRSYTIAAPVAASVSGQTFIQTANGDKAVTPGSTNFMSFTLGQAAAVYVALDQRITVKPTWLTSAFSDTGTTIQGGDTTPVPFELYVRSYPANATVTLGSNIPSGGDTHNSMYSVIVVPTQLGEICATAAVVGLQWTPVNSATSYSLTRNGTSLATGIPVTYYNDQTVAGSTSYTYTLTALSSSGSTLSTQNLGVTTAAASTNGDAPYCQSTVIPSMSVNWGAGVVQQNGSDLWAQTQASDGNDYGFWGDGDGFGGNDDSVTNDPNKVSWGIGQIPSTTPGSLSGAVNVYGGINPQHPASLSGKATGLLAIGNNFYALGGVTFSNDSTHGGGAPTQEIVYSTGNAWSWQDNASNWIFCRDKVTAGFCPTAFLQNGPGYSGNTDGYVYLYGGTESEYYGDNAPAFPAYLWRVKTASILDNTAYQAFTGFDTSGNPTWATGTFDVLFTKMQPIFMDRNSRPLPFSAVIYDAHLGRYIASAGGAVNQAAFYEAPNPWGPWATIGYFNSNPADNSGGWGNLGAGAGFGSGHGDGLGFNFLDKWTSSDGKTLWIVFSSDGNAGPSASLVALRNKSMDSFIAVPITLTTAQ